MEVRTHQRIITAFLFLSFLTTLCGCTGIQPFPMAARAGDTITLAIGSLDNITPANTTATYHAVDQFGVETGTYPLTSGIRTIFRLYPDKTSLAWHATDAKFMKNWSGHGPWLSSMVMDLPDGLPEGNGWVEIVPGPSVEYPNNAKRVENVEIGLEILPGEEGTKNNFEHFSYSGALDPQQIPSVGNLDLLKPAPQALIRMPPARDGSNGGLSIAAAEFFLNISIRDSSGNEVPSNNAIRVVLDDDPYSNLGQVQLSWTRNGDQIMVNLMSPTGGLASGTIRFSVILIKQEIYKLAGINYVVNNDVNFVDTPYIQSDFYFDIDGNDVVLGRSPEIIVRN